MRVITQIKLFILVPTCSMVLYTSIPNISYYTNPIPKKDLIPISGIIINDSPTNTGIAVLDQNNQKNYVYCDNPKFPIVKTGSRTAVPNNIGDCAWVANKLKEMKKCKQNELRCTNPRTLYNKKILALVDKNNTIYTLFIDHKLFYSYDDMVDMYKLALHDYKIQATIYFFAFLLMIFSFFLF